MPRRWPVLRLPLERLNRTPPPSPPNGDRAWMTGSRRPELSRKPSSEPSPLTSPRQFPDSQGPTWIAGLALLVVLLVCLLALSSCTTTRLPVSLPQFPPPPASTSSDLPGLTCLKLCPGSSPTTGSASPGVTK